MLEQLALDVDSLRIARPTTPEGVNAVLLRHCERLFPYQPGSGSTDPNRPTQVVHTVRQMWAAYQAYKTARAGNPALTRLQNTSATLRAQRKSRKTYASKASLIAKLEFSLSSKRPRLPRKPGTCTSCTITSASYPPKDPVKISISDPPKVNLSHLKLNMMPSYSTTLVFSVETLPTPNRPAYCNMNTLFLRRSSQSLCPNSEAGVRSRQDPHRLNFGST